MTRTSIYSMISTRIYSITPTRIYSMTQTRIYSITPTRIYSMISTRIYSMTSTRIYSMISTRIYSMISTRIFSMRATRIYSMISTRIYTMISTRIYSMRATRIYLTGEGKHWKQRPRLWGTDSDAKLWHIDNCSSSSMSFDRDDFVGTLKACHTSVGALGGTSVAATHKGTLVCKIQCNEGAMHTIRIPNLYYVLQSEYRILCPQHWAQEAQDHHPQPRGAWCATYNNVVELYWDQQQFTKTIRLDKHLNVGRMMSAPGYCHAISFMASTRKRTNTSHKLCLAGTFEWKDWASKRPESPSITPVAATDNKESKMSEDENSKAELMDNPEGEPDSTLYPLVTTEWMPTKLDYRTPSTKELEKGKKKYEFLIASSIGSELYQWYLCLGHMPYISFVTQAKHGVIQKRFWSFRHAII